LIFKLKNKNIKFILSIVAVLSIGIFLSINSKYFTPRIWADLTYQALKDETSFQSGGRVRIEGWIYNRDSKDINIIIRLKVNYGASSGYYGFSWITYDVPIGIIPKGDRKWFSFEGHLNPFDSTTAIFNYTIIEIE
jgi:hypothetical protein